MSAQNRGIGVKSENIPPKGFTRNQNNDWYLMFFHNFSAKLVYLNTSLKWNSYQSIMHTFPLKY